MSDLKNQLIKIGESNPDLRPHLRPILDKVASRKVEAATSKFNLNGTPSYLKMEGMDSLEKALRGFCTIENLEWYVSPGMSYVDVYVTWDTPIRRDDIEEMKAELENRVLLQSPWGKHMTRMGAHVHLQGGSFTLNL